MNLRSFRLRIVMLAVTLTGSALVGFGIVSWWLIYDAKVSRLDAELKSQLLDATRFRSPDRWQSYADSLPLSFGTNIQTPVALVVIGQGGEQIYQSQQWNTSLEASVVMPSRPPRPPALFQPDRPLPRSPDESEMPLDRPPFRSKPPQGAPQPPQPELTTHKTSAVSWRVGVVAARDYQVAIAVSLQAIDREMGLIRNIFLVGIPIVLLLSVAGAWVISSNTLIPIRKLTATIRSMNAQDLDRRISVGTTDIEFVDMINVVNQMLERLERSFNQASRFSGDAAHEIKTPLAILQGELERTLQQAEPESKMQQSLASLLDEVQRLSAIVRKLLLLSLADAGRMNLHYVEIDLTELLTAMVEDMDLLAPHLNMQSNMMQGLRVCGDRDLLTQAWQNLFGNAIKYNLPNGWIKLDSFSQHAVISITITNSSTDIPPSERDRIFDRFHRGDFAQTHRVEGSGLGLSLAREIARAHGGDLTLDLTASGQTAFTFSLPVGDRSRF